jgi:hypothetical protein
VFGVRGRDSLGQLLQRHPINAHGSLLDYKWDAPHPHLHRGSQVGSVGRRRETWRLPVVLAAGADKRKARLEISMPAHVKTERGPAQHDGIEQRSTAYVLDDVGNARSLEPLPYGGDQVLAWCDMSRTAPVGGEGLARRGCPDKVKAGEREVEHVRLDESPTTVISGLRMNVHSRNGKSSPVEAG